MSATASPFLLPGSPEAAQLQAQIHAELVKRAYADEGDTTMAEYVSVMLINRKTPEQVGQELADLLGSDFDPSFTTWLYQCLDEVIAGSTASGSQPGPSTSIGNAATSSSLEPESDIDMRDRTPAKTSINGSGRLLSTALASTGKQPPAAPHRGVKRERGQSPAAMDIEDGNKRRSVGGRSSDDRPTSVPNGPRRSNGGQRGLIERIGGPIGMNPNAGEFRGGRGPRGGGPMGMGRFPHRMQPGAPFGDPRMIAAMQHQQNMFAAAAMNGGQNGFYPGAAGDAVAMAEMLRQHQEQMMAMQAMMHQMASVVQGQASPVAPTPPSAQPQQKLGDHIIDARKGVNGSASAKSKPSADKGQVPTKPSSSDICKYGVGCTNIRCPYSHPSPVATQQSGVVLRTDACPNGKECKDADCGYSHVSPAQVSSETPGTLRVLCKFPVCTNPSCQFRHEDADGNPIPPPALTKKLQAASAFQAAGSSSMETDDHDELDVRLDAGSSNSGLAANKPNLDEALSAEPTKKATAQPLPGKPLNGTIAIACRFGSGCTNRNCKFVHDGRKPCKFGTKCHRADCSFSHPPGRELPISKQGFTEFRPRGDGAHISQRTFAQTDGPTEKALPGHAQEMDGVEGDAGTKEIKTDEANGNAEIVNVAVATPSES